MRIHVLWLDAKHPYTTGIYLQRGDRQKKKKTKTAYSSTPERDRIHVDPLITFQMPFEVIIKCLELRLYIN